MQIKLDEDEKRRVFYLDETRRAMELLAQNPKVIFIGQTCRYAGSPMYASLKNVPLERKIELPIMEDVQMGMSIGLSLEGLIPVSIFPRIDFLIIATNQLINHLDKVEEMSKGEFRPKVIIRTQIGNKAPLYPGIQHCSDYTDALKILCENIYVVKLEKAEEIVPSYLKALKADKSTILIEVGQGRG